MITSQKIFINIDGSIEGLQVKKNKGVDLREFGKAKIERASEILFEEDLQKWYVKILVGAFEGLVLTKNVFSEFCPHINVSYAKNVLYFDDYDTAVAHEIEFLDSIRSIWGSL